MYFKTLIIERQAYIILLLSVIFTAVATLLKSQPHSPCTSSISGTVADFTTDTPLYGAVLEIPELGLGVTVDENGQYLFKNLCPCPDVCRLQVSHLGYKTIIKPIQWSGSGNRVIDFFMEEDNRVLHEVMVKGVKNETGLASLTAQGLSGEDLERQRGSNLGDALSVLPGVSTLQTGANISKPVIHGMHSNRILTLYNGIRLEGQQWGMEHGPEIDPFIASKISVVKGAASVKYGSDALGGVVIVNPPELMGRSGIAGELYTLGMSNGRAGIASSTLEGGGQWGKSMLGWRVQGTARKSGDMKAAKYILTNTASEEINFSGAFGYHRSRWGMENFFSRYSTETGLLRATASSTVDELGEAIASPMPDPVLDFSYRIDVPRQEVKHDVFHTKVHYDFNQDEKLSLFYGHQINRRKEFDVRRRALVNFPSLNLEITTNTLDIAWEHHLIKQGKGTLGINYMEQENRNISGTRLIALIPNYNQSAIGAYLLQQFNYGQWLFEAGLRFDRKYYKLSGRNGNQAIFRNSLTYTNITGTIGASFDIDRKMSLSTNIGTAWRPPHMAELYSTGFNQGTASVEYGLALLEGVMPMKDLSSIKNEQGLKWVNTYSLNQHSLSLEASGYINWVNNYIYLRPEGVTQRSNGSYPILWYRQTEALFAGFDLSAAYLLTDSWKAEGKLNYIETKDMGNNDYFIFMPNNHLEISLEHKRTKLWRFQDFYFKVGTLYTDRQRNGPRRIIPPKAFNAIYADEGGPFEKDKRNFDFKEAPAAYALVQFETGISSTWGRHRLDLKLKVSNALNSSYREYTNRLRYYADDLGRNFILGLKYSF